MPPNVNVSLGISMKTPSHFHVKPWTTSAESEQTRNWSNWMCWRGQKGMQVVTMHHLRVHTVFTRYSLKDICNLHSPKLYKLHHFKWTWCAVCGLSYVYKLFISLLCVCFYFRSHHKLTEMIKFNIWTKVICISLKFYSYI